MPPEAKFCLNCGAPTPTEVGQEGSAAPPVEVQVERLRAALADRYRIERVLGYGGMATVYLAEDLRHDRKVAVKVLRPELAAAIGSDRFLREIRIAAKLQHPHILMLIDSGEADGFLYYVMPLVEGESLRQKLSRERELPLPDAVRILREVVDALAHAHAQGVVHRDIKPDNVMLSGRHALVVDFGVAKAVSQATGQFAPTTAGLSLGTPTYMSPEQAAADPKIDHRADIYAVGVMAYELLTGEPPIKGQSPQAVLAAQVNQVPKPVHEVRSAVPPQLSHLVMRCLEKRPADRWQRAEDLLPQLEALTTPSLGLTPSTTPVVARRRRWMPWMGVAAATVAAAAIVFAIVQRGGAEGSLPQPEPRQLTFDGDVRLAELSPDGQWLAYVVGEYPEFTVRVRDLAGESHVDIVDSMNVFSLRWSPDGTRLAVAGGIQGRYSVYLYPRLGGAPQPSAIYRPYSVWSPDGRRLGGWYRTIGSGVLLYDLLSGGRDTLAVPGEDIWLFGGDWAPHRDVLALVSRSGDGSTAHLWAIDIATGGHTLILADSSGETPSVRWARAGDAVYVTRQQALYRIGVDPQSGLVKGSPRRVLALEGGTSFSLSSDGRQVAYMRESGYANFSLVKARGSAVEQHALTRGTAEKTCPALSPDGTAVAFVQESSEGKHVYRVSAEGGTPERLTFDGSVVVCPAWAPDGKSLAYGIRAGGSTKLAIVSAGGGPPRLFEDTRLGPDLQWAPNVDVMYQVPGNRNYRLLDVRTEAERPLVPNDSVGWVVSAQPSPNRRQVAVRWNRRDDGLWLIALDGSTQERLAEGSWWPVGWSTDGRSIYARNPDGTLKRFPSAGGEGVALQQPDVDETVCLPYERPQGLVWLCTESRSFSDVWMVENFDPEYAGKSH